MGNLRDRLLDSAQTWGEYSSQVHDTRPSRRAMRETTHALPAPHNHRNPNITEREILLQTKKILSHRAGWWRRIEVQGNIQWGTDPETGESVGRYNSSGMVGMADLMALIDGTLWALELKAPGGRLKGSQLSELQTVKRAGGQAAVLCGTKSLEILLADVASNQARIYQPWGIFVY